MTRGFLNSSIAWWFYVYAHMYYDVKMRDNRFTYDKNKNTSYRVTVIINFQSSKLHRILCGPF